jgi:F-type H+-transporting ATPase subunit epsilon
VLTVEVVSPERVLYSGEATMVTCRTVGGGDIAFLTGHVSFIGALSTWPVKVVTESEDVHIAVHGGFVEVSNDRVTILSDVAELADQIDVTRAERARDRAEGSLRDDAEDEEAKAALARAQVRLQVAAVPAGAGPRH